MVKRRVEFEQEKIQIALTSLGGDVSSDDDDAFVDALDSDEEVQTAQTNERRRKKQKKVEQDALSHK